MPGLFLSDHIRNVYLRKRTGVSEIIDRISQLKWNWIGHIAHMRDDGWTKKS